MTLDLEQVAIHVPSIIETVRRERQAMLDRRDTAIGGLQAAARDADAFTARILGSRTQRALALPFADPPDAAIGAPDVSAYAVLAVDGSHIQAQRDSPAPCSVMNFGWCRIVYRESFPPDLRAETEVQVASAQQGREDEDDHLFSADATGLLRAVREVTLAARLVGELPAAVPAVVLLDGSLVPWSINRLSRDSAQRRQLLFGPGGLFPALDWLRGWATAAPGRALAAYTSYPSHREVLHALQEQLPAETAAALNSVTDRGLFWEHLRPWQRSGRFKLHSKREGWMEREFENAHHALTFFYLRTDTEVARVELPEWVAGDEAKVELVHAAAVDQIRRGLGYPLALMEAHERAVISGADRQAFAHLVESALLAEGLAAFGSAKNLSKRGRWLT